MNALLLLVGLAVAATMPAGADEHALKPHMVGAKKAADLNCPAQVPGGALWEKQAVRCPGSGGSINTMDNGESTELGNFNNFDTKGFATPNGHFTFNDCAVLCNFLAAECSSFEFCPVSEAKCRSEVKLDIGTSLDPRPESGLKNAKRTYIIQGHTYELDTDFSNPGSCHLNKASECKNMVADDRDEFVTCVKAGDWSAKKIDDLGWNWDKQNGNAGEEAEADAEAGAEA